MNSINLYNPSSYGKQTKLKYKSGLRFDGYGRVIKKPYNFNNDICAKTPDSEYCLEFLLEKIRKLKGYQVLLDNLNSLHVTEITTPAATKPLNRNDLLTRQYFFSQKIINEDGTIIDKTKVETIKNTDLERVIYNIKLQKTRQKLVDLNLIKPDGTIVGLNKILIKNGKNKLPKLDMPDTNMEISGGKFDVADFIRGNKVLIKGNVIIPGSVEAKTLEVHDVYVDIARANEINAHGKAKLGIVEAGFMRIYDKAQIICATVKGWTIATGAATIGELKTNYFKVFNNVYADEVTAKKVIAFGSPTFGSLKTRYIEKHSKNIIIKRSIVDKNYPMVSVQIEHKESELKNDKKILTEKLNKLRLNIKNPVKNLFRQINLYKYKNVSNE